VLVMSAVGDGIPLWREPVPPLATGAAIERPGFSSWERWSLLNEKQMQTSKPNWYALLLLWIVMVLIGILVDRCANGAEVTRQRVYESNYQPYTIVALLVDAGIDAYQAGGLNDDIEIDYDSIKLDWHWKPWRVSYSYTVRFGGVVARKTTIADARRVQQTAFVTGNIGELSSAFWTSDAVRTDNGTTIVNTLSVEWYPHSRCRLVRRLASRIAESRVIPPMVDKGLATIETKVRGFAHSGSLWPVLEELRGGLR
jgi:hypothetical protein